MRDSTQDTRNRDLISSLSVSEKQKIISWADDFDLKTQATYKQRGPDFDALYGPGTWDRDSESVARAQAKFEGQEQLYGKALEYIISTFGPVWIPGKIRKASAYDDIMRKVDLFIEIQVAEGVWAPIAVDVTTKSTDVNSKFTDAIDEIKSGRLHEVKYFISKANGEAVVKSAEMPRLVIGVEEGSVIRLIRMITRYSTAKAQNDEALSTKLLTDIKNDPVGPAILDQLSRELEKFLAITETIEDENPLKTKVKTKLSQLSKIFSRFMKNKRAPERALDAVHGAVLDAVA